MRVHTLLIISLSFLSAAAWSQDFAFPAGFKTQSIATNGTSISVRVGGKGPGKGNDQFSGQIDNVYLVIG